MTAYKAVCSKQLTATPGLQEPTWPCWSLALHVAHMHELWHTARYVGMRTSLHVCCMRT